MKKGGKRGQSGAFTPALFHILCRALFYYHFPPELRVGPRFFRCSTISVLLIETGGKNRAKNEENGEKGEKGREKGWVRTTRMLVLSFPREMTPYNSAPWWSSQVILNGQLAVVADCTTRLEPGTCFRDRPCNTCYTSEQRKTADFLYKDLPASASSSTLSAFWGLPLSQPLSSNPR
jgi:hypothetical protein